ncbi:hypothetical protein B7463_g6574, partial [Scytalidium lignicola]
MRVHTRLGASLLLSLLSLTTIILLLPRTSISSKLQQIALSKDYKELWNWVSQDDFVGGDGLRVVVFGNSWADDTVEPDERGKGISWVKVFCHEMNCSSYLNFATSRPAKFPSSSLVPQGALMSNTLYEASIAETNSSAMKSPPKIKLDVLPDLASQIQKFIALPPAKPLPTETIFIVEFGIWDIYYFASLDYDAGQSLTDMSIGELFRQLDVLYAHYCKEFSMPTNGSNSDSEDNRTFQVIIPKLFDPTLLPGWMSQREIPAAPTSVAEQHKNAVYLTTRWNSNLENGMGNWVNNEVIDDSGWMQFENTDKEGDQSSDQAPTVLKDTIYYDTDKYLTDVLVEHQLQDANLTDSTGFGSHERLFENIYTPCLRGVDDEIENGDVEINGQRICQHPEEYLFWDEFGLGSVAKAAMGKEIALMVKKKKTFGASNS